MKKKLGVFLTRGYLDSAPSLRDGLVLLAENGYSIDIYMPIEPGCLPPQYALEDIHVIPLPRSARPGKLGWAENVITQARHTWQCVGHQHYHCLIGVDAEGLLLATLVGRKLRSLVIYYSLEVLCTSDKNSLGFRLLKTLERACHRRVLFTIIQDEARADLLKSENRIASMPYILVPNAARGRAEFRRTTFLRDKLGISKERLLILHVGSVAPWTMAVELARAAQSWPDKWVIIFHCRERPNDSYGQQLLGLADGEKVIVSPEPVSYNLLAELVASADIGIALYRIRSHDAILGKNLYTMGKSSGKIAQYLQKGVPVIASDFPSIQRYIDKYVAGTSVSDTMQVRDSIETIRAGYSCYVSGALQCFQQEFDLDSHFAQITAELKVL